MKKVEIHIYVKRNPKMYPDYPEYVFEPKKMVYVVQSKFTFLLKLKTFLKLWKLDRMWNDSPTNIHTTIYSQEPEIVF